VSAIKVDGKRSYARVRAGEDVDLPARPVTVHAFEATAFRLVGDLLDVDVRVACSSGTYVRALARDLGAALGVGGHLTMLRRTRVGGFDITVARTLEELETSFEVVLLDDVARRTFPVLELDADQATDVRFGRALPGTSIGADGPVALIDPDGRFLALYEQRGSDARAVAVFV
jgi:tRNA pseudouridine55 synthase